MLVMTALHSFAARLGDKKPDKSHLQPELLLLLSIEDIK